MMNKDFEWFRHNYKKLFIKYGHCFLAIKDRKVIGVYKTYSEGVKSTSKREKLGTFIVQECDSDESCLTNYISSMSFK